MKLPRRPGRGRRRPTLGGRKRMNLRWEVGAPLIVLGTIVAGLMLGVEGGGVLFWGAALTAGVGLAVFVDSG